MHDVTFTLKSAIIVLLSVDKISDKFIVENNFISHAVNAISATINIDGNNFFI